MIETEKDLVRTMVESNLPLLAGLSYHCSGDRATTIRDDIEVDYDRLRGFRSHPEVNEQLAFIAFHHYRIRSGTIVTALTFVTSQGSILRCLLPEWHCNRLKLKSNKPVLF